jgi:hypothetical protein
MLGVPREPGNKFRGKCGFEGLFLLTFAQLKEGVLPTTVSYGDRTIIIKDDALDEFLDVRPSWGLGFSG